tara:strand:+ start:344 stop:1372 length:1029 start_codon:yes stop_codon:yes gene_type:complete
MKMFKLLSAGFILGFGLSDNAFGEAVTLKFHSFAPAPASQNSKFVRPWANRIEEQSAGELRIETYYSMQLGGKPAQLVDQVRDGVVDIIWTVAGYTPGRFPKLEVFDLPFLPGSAEATSQAAQEFAQTIAIDELKEYKVLTVHVHAPGKIHTKNRLVTQLSDLEGLKIRGPTRVISSMLGAMGATPVGMPVPQVAPSLSKGVIDGMVVPYEIMPSFKLHELTKAHTTVSGQRGLYTTAFLFLMNKAKYESLSVSQKAVIDNNSGMSLAKLAGQLWDEFEGPALEMAKKAGGDFHSLSGQQLAAFQAVGDQVVSDWITKANTNGMDGAGIVQTTRDLISKYEN